MDEKLRASVGKRLRGYRESLGLTRDQFAEKANLSAQFITEVESGRKGCSVESLYKICTAFEVSADYIIFGKPNMNFSSPANVLLENVRNEYMEEYMAIIAMANSLVEKVQEDNTW